MSTLARTILSRVGRHVEAGPGVCSCGLFNIESQRQHVEECIDHEILAALRSHVIRQRAIYAVFNNTIGDPLAGEPMVVEKRLSEFIVADADAVLDEVARCLS